MDPSWQVLFPDALIGAQDETSPLAGYRPHESRPSVAMISCRG